jgi:dipeptidase D
MAIINSIEPAALFQYFEEIAKIPRPSKHEEKIIDFLIDFAKQHHLDYKKDKIGNLLITKPASQSSKKGLPIVLQSHVDMVCEKNSSVMHDFMSDPIIPYIDGEWIKARGTTLGADDGIGVAAMMNVLADNTLEHGPIECLFTVDEETGLTGAFEIPSKFFTGNILLNLDSEDEGILFIGCAGGIDTLATFKYTPQPVIEDSNAFFISITGLTGGHSGDDIHRGRGNAVKIMNDFLLEATHQFDIDLHKFEGGNLKNAIAREAFATVLVSAELEKSFTEFCDAFGKSTKEVFSDTDPSFNFTVEQTSIPETRFKKDFQIRFLESLKQCPHGAISWSKDIQGLVETSTNLASVKFGSHHDILVTTSQRSSVEAANKSIASKVASVFSDAGAEIKHSAGYPGWAPNMKSKILGICSQAYQDLFGEQPKITAIHAGLECGLFLEKYPKLDMISFGPTIYGAHSPDERLHIPSVKKFWDLLVEILKRGI